MTGRCRDCRYWFLNELSWKNQPTTQEGAERWAEHHDCIHPALKALPHGEGVMMEGITTAPDFGCVQFEPRE